jgi:hypothetical protein
VDFRFRADNGLTSDIAPCPKSAKNRHVTTASGCSFHVINGVAARLKVQDVPNQGGDTVLAYTGTYFKNGDRFSASVRTQRHSLGQPSVFGIDNLDLTLTGKSTPTTASCTGTGKQAPADFAERSVFYKPRFGIAT